jgi:hypothetical protein
VIDPSIGISATTRGAGSTITVNNSGAVHGGDVGIVAFSKYGTTTIINSGDISAKSLFAIDVDGGAATIINSGHITGFVDLTDSDEPSSTRRAACSRPSSRAISAMAAICSSMSKVAPYRPPPIPRSPNIAP